MKFPELITGEPCDLNLLRRCANCDAGEDEASDTTAFKLCGICRAAFYCSKHCQSDNWILHESLCGGGTSYPGGKVLRALLLPYNRLKREWNFVEYDEIDASGNLTLTRDGFEWLLPEGAVWFQTRFEAVCRLLKKKSHEKIKTMDFLLHPISGKTFSKMIRVWWIDRYQRVMELKGKLKQVKDVLAVGLQVSGTAEVPDDWSDEDLKTIWDAKRYDLTMYDATTITKWLKKHRRNRTGPWANIDHTVAG